MVLAERRLKEAVVVSLVGIRMRRHASRHQHFFDAAHVGGPAGARQPPHDIGPSHVAVRHGGVAVVGHGLEGRQHIAPTPIARAHLFPDIVVAGQTAERDHAHHTRSAAHHARLQEGDGRFALAEARRQAGPEVVAVDVGGRKDIADVGRDFARCGIPAGFDQQDAARRVFRQARRERGPGRACSHHNNVSFANVGFANVRIAHVAQVPGSAQYRRNIRSFSPAVNVDSPPMLQR